MLMADQNGRNAARIEADCLETFESLAAGDAGINQNASFRTLHHGSISAAAAGEHRDTNSHVPQHTFVDCGNGSNFWVKPLLSSKVRGKSCLMRPKKFVHAPAAEHARISAHCGGG